MASIGQTQGRAATTIRTPLFIVGVALALVAFLAMFAFGILFANRAQGVGLVEVAVAARDIQAREPITLDMVTLSKVPSNAVPPRAISNLQVVTSFTAVVAIYKGEVMTANVVAANADEIQAGDVSSYLPIPRGYVAMTIPSGEQQAVAGYVAPGDYIDVLADVDLGQFSPTKRGRVTKTVFNSLYVIRVGPQSSAPRKGQPQGVASSVTVVLSLCDAQFMDWLIANTTLRYTLLSYHDYASSVAAPDTTCPPTNEPGAVGALQVDGRWGFTKG